MNSSGDTLRILAGGGLALATAMGVGRFAYTPLLPIMQRAAGFSTGAAGLLASANYAGYLVGALLIALVPPDFPRRRVLLGSLVVVGVTTALMAVTTDLLVWGLVRFLSGLASAGVFVLASGLVLTSLRMREATSLAGWLYAGVGVGITTSGVVVRLGTGIVGWRGDWLTLAIVAFLTVYPCWRWLPAQEDRGKGDRPEGPRSHQHLQGPVPILFMAYFFEAVGYIVTGTFLVAIVAHTPGLESIGPNVWIVVGLAGVPAAVLWPAIGRRVGTARALAIAYGTQACGILLPILGGAASAYGCAICFGGTFLGITALTLSLASHLTPHRAANIIGLLTAVYGVGQILGPIFAASVASHAHSFTPALIAASAVVLLGGVLMMAFHLLDSSDAQKVITLNDRKSAV